VRWVSGFPKASEYQDAMNDQFDFELTSDQWETLKALRSPATSIPRINRFTVESLIALGLVAARGGSPVLSLQGRKVLVRGSSRLLLDIAA
jgi:hypothetical protein